MQVPIDVITGSSMGAIVGGLYASGLRANELEWELRAVRWGEAFANRVERRQLSQRRAWQVTRWPAPRASAPPPRPVAHARSSGWHL